MHERTVPPLTVIHVRKSRGMVTGGRLAVKAVRDFFLCPTTECFTFLSNGVNCGERLGSVRDNPQVDNDLDGCYYIEQETANEHLLGQRC